MVGDVDMADGAGIGADLRQRVEPPIDGVEHVEQQAKIAADRDDAGTGDRHAPARRADPLDVLALMRRLVRVNGKAAVAVLHDINPATAIADMMVFMKDGILAA